MKYVISEPLSSLPADPDLVSGDGVYSRHATKVMAAPGRYSFRFHVDDNENQAFVATLPPNRNRRQQGPRPMCCGSIVSINPDETEKTGVFRRSVAGPVVHIFPTESKSGRRAQDTTPPNRIGDLKVHSFNHFVNCNCDCDFSAWRSNGPRGPTGSRLIEDVKFSIR